MTTVRSGVVLVMTSCALVACSDDSTRGTADGGAQPSFTGVVREMPPGSPVPRARVTLVDGDGN
jgi:hypothetical protein